MKSTTELRAFFGSANGHGQRLCRGPQILRLGVALAVTLANVTSAQTYTVLKNFTGGDGQNPCAGLVLSGSTLYGTTQSGGSSSNGVVFKMNTDGSGYTVLKDFTGGDGQSPFGDLVLAGSTLYGTTIYGGDGDHGVVFEVNADGSGYAALKSFTWSEGAYPCGGLVLAGSALYGTTANGGTSTYPFGAGAVFKLNTDGSGCTALKSFTGSDGANPEAGLVLGGSTLYGTTSQGGDPSVGVVFKVNTDGSGYTVLKNLDASDGVGPQASLILSGSTLYGTTTWGGGASSGPYSGYGVVFKMNADGSGYVVLKNFTGGDGQGPRAGLALWGSTLYGTTAWGGSSSSGPDSGYGVAFQVNTDGSGYTVLKSFTGSDGASPRADLVLAGNTLYGTTFGGGSSGCGVVFSVTMTPPSMTTPPATQTAEMGSVGSFLVEVTDTPPESTYYQWYFGDTNALGGATNASLELTNVQPFQAGAYTVVVTNLYGAVTSAPALLSVIAPVESQVVSAIHLPGGTSNVLHLEYADSLADAPTWSSFTNLTLSGGPQLCFDLSQPLSAQRFYRAWQTNGPQPMLDMSMATEIPLAGAIGSSVQIDYINRFGPTNAWVTLDTVTLTNSPQLYFDATMFRQPTRLYRLVGLP
ncbi:MAG TPA: choice-of-anchor tandem repeat GloVer-containing protein [Dongiaceae bacterium]|nr:choice-of-anchor tandem repeat GloVer-containing protein [Dongiaceae bacterium]